MATGFAYRVFGTPTDAKKWTFSCWHRKGTDSTSHIFGGGQTNQTGGGHSYIGLIPNAYANYYDGNNQWNFESTAKYRDVNGWYHITVRYDSANNTETERFKYWVNGELITSWTNSNYPSLNYSTMWNNNGITHYLGRRGQSQSFEGSLSHVHFCDGYAYSASDFGETDSATGEWKIKASPSVNYGNNGFWLFKDDASMTDQSPNSNNFTLSGSITPTQDNPSNLFATLNPLFYSADVTLSNGNTTAVESSNNWRSAYSNIGVSTGKWYWEAQISYQSGNEAYFGLAHEDHMNGYDVTYGGNSSAGAPNQGGYDYLGYSTKSFGVYSNGNQDYPSSTTYTGAYNNSTYTMSFALDIPNRKLYVARNGVWTNASNNGWGSSTFDSTVGALDISGKIPATGFIFPGFSPNESTWKVNFGNGYFGTTEITSPQDDDAGQGKFQYNPPTGYYAICTKNINAYG